MIRAVEGPVVPNSRLIATTENRNQTSKPTPNSPHDPLALTPCVPNPTSYHPTQQIQPRPSTLAQISPNSVAQNRPTPVAKLTATPVIPTEADHRESDDPRSGGTRSGAESNVEVAGSTYASAQACRSTVDNEGERCVAGRCARRPVKSTWRLTTTVRLNSATGYIAPTTCWRSVSRRSTMNATAGWIPRQQRRSHREQAPCSTSFSVLESIDKPFRLEGHDIQAGSDGPMFLRKVRAI